MTSKIKSLQEEISRVEDPSWSSQRDLEALLDQPPQWTEGVDFRVTDIELDEPGHLMQG